MRVTGARPGGQVLRGTAEAAASEAAVTRLSRRRTPPCMRAGPQRNGHLPEQETPASRARRGLRCSGGCEVPLLSSAAGASDLSRHAPDPGARAVSVGDALVALSARGVRPTAGSGAAAGSSGPTASGAPDGGRDVCERGPANGGPLLGTARSTRNARGGDEQAACARAAATAPRLRSRSPFGGAGSFFCAQIPIAHSRHAGRAGSPRSAPGRAGQRLPLFRSDSSVQRYARTRANSTNRLRCPSQRRQVPVGHRSRRDGTQLMVPPARRFLLRDPHCHTSGGRRTFGDRGGSLCRSPGLGGLGARAAGAFTKR